MNLKNRFVPPKVGDSLSFRKTMTVAEQAMFTGISGNLGSLYVDRSAATAGGLADMAVFELAAASLLSTCLSRMAGPGYRISRFTSTFHGAVAIGSTFEATATLVEIKPEELVFSLGLMADGAPFAEGEATLALIQGE
jgi:acyl dehydratase